MAEGKSFTGRRRERRTRFSVRVIDVIAKLVICFGGIGTIAAVSTVGLFLVWVVLPLFQSPTVEPNTEFQSPWDGVRPIAFQIDESQSLCWALMPDGELLVIAIDGGKIVRRDPLFVDGGLTAVGTVVGSDQVVAAFEDGTVRLGTIDFRTQYLEFETVPADLAGLQEGQAVVYQGDEGSGVILRTSQGQLRLQSVDAEFQPAMSVTDSPIVLVSALAEASEQMFAYVTEAGRAALCTVERKANLFTQETTHSIGEQFPLTYETAASGPPGFLLLSTRGDSLYLGWKNGQLLRYVTGDRNNIQLAEDNSLIDDEAQVTALDYLLGRSTIVCGDSQGRLSGWFLARTEEAATPDGRSMVRAHDLPRITRSPVTSLGMSARTRLVAAGYADGTTCVFQVTTDEPMYQQSSFTDEAVAVVGLAPKDDGLYTASKGAFKLSRFDPKHPEVSWSAMFAPVWYEGYSKPEYVWQSSGASEDLEPKLSLMPLIFGTVKATIYTMLFGAPLALLAAIYTSEFLSPRNRMRVKPVIEVMASLPSVVLGFLAALVFAPLVEHRVPSILAAFAAVPMTVMLGAYLWQLLPYTLTLSLSRYRILFVIATIPIGVLIARVAGPVAESVLFSGDFVRWLDGQIGSGIGGWFVILLPLSGVLAASFAGVIVNPLFRAKTHDWNRSAIAWCILLKFVLTCGAACAVSYLLGFVLTTIGWDPRGGLLGTYVQRNALIVGFVMGFAVIPIIYTIADDALASVPDHLRSASLGAGATPWQTAVRIVVPTAMSGLFSALMVGLGRAVGETMIVLMAGGNTPVMEWNPFNGFRTLSANIAVELPEAVRNSTHYRTLFLAALTLFLMTFAVNSAAEFVRIRFRRRVYEL